MMQPTVLSTSTVLQTPQSGLQTGFAAELLLLLATATPALAPVALEQLPLARFAVLCCCWQKNLS